MGMKMHADGTMTFVARSGNLATVTPTVNSSGRGLGAAGETSGSEGV